MIQFGDSLDIPFLAAKQQLYIPETWVTDWLTGSPLALLYVIGAWYMSSISQKSFIYIAGISQAYIRHISGIY